MSPTPEFLGVSAGLSLLVSRYAPQYSFGIFWTGALLFLLQLIGYVLWSVILYPRFFSPFRNLPTAPGGNLFIGQARRILSEPAGNPSQDWIDNVPNDGLIRYTMWFSERLLVTNPKTLGEVLVTKNYDFVKPQQFRDGLGRLLGIGILLAEGDEHKMQRKNLMPAFSYRHIKDLYAGFWEKSAELNECLSEASRSTTPSSVKSDQSAKDAEKAAADVTQHAPGTLEVGNWSSRATLDIVGRFGLGQDFNSLHDQDNKLNHTYRSIFSDSRQNQILQLVGLFLPFWFLSRLPLKRNADIYGASDYIKQICRDMIAQKRKDMAEKRGTEVDIISVALESGGFTDEELVNQMMTFLVAGHETTATAMIWAIYLLCKHPEVQQKLRDEVRTKLPSPEEDVTAADFDDCHYLHGVCNEVLRIWSPVTLTLRVAGVDTSINGQFVPKGTRIILSPKGVNTSKHLWGPDARDFKPERWLDADGKSNNKGSADSNFSFLTFLHGPRSCIGQKFAQAEFECLLAAWAGRFDTQFEEGSSFANGEDPDIKGGITSKPKGGLWVKLNELEGW